MASQLSSEHMAQLVPLLGSLARLLSQHGTIADEQFQVLLDATDLDAHPAALAELQRWARLLARMRGAENPALRQTVVESLLLRGLPEASVLLAVATVVGSGTGSTQTTAIPPARLQASVSSLDFGSLRPGQGATLELEVQGDPGQVIVESDQIQVTPTQFGAEPTRLRVTIKPLASGLLWTALKLVTAGETREVPVVAQWQDVSVSASQPVSASSNSISQQAQPAIVATPSSGRETNASAVASALPVISAPPGLVWQSYGLDLDMVEVPTGPFLMGSSIADPQAQSDEQPQHTLTLPTYWIGKTGVTNAQFRAFVAGDGYTNETYWDTAGWQWRTEKNRTQPTHWNNADFNSSNQPVVGISWYEAMAYTRWLSAQTGQIFSLPTEAEWEKAARGTDGRIYPWGNTWEAGRANSSEARIGKTTLVSQYPGGSSPYGVLDMVGNVWEWTRSIYTRYPYEPTDGREDLSTSTGKCFSIRGGSWFLNAPNLRIALHDFVMPAIGDRNIGLRLTRYPQR